MSSLQLPITDYFPYPDDDDERDNAEDPERV